MATSSYDQVLYHSRPMPETHPDRLAALGVMLGLNTTLPERSRILEIGCATGGNLFNLADLYPNAEFIGIDPSVRQIEAARSAATALGLHNLRFETIGIESIEEAWGPFDFIICHGVYSWVPESVRAPILAACRRWLAPNGVAYISYNTKPGWHLRLPIREMMIWHTRHLADPQQRIAQSRAVVKFVADNLIQPDVTWARLVQDELKLFSDKSDHYVGHEHLEENNEAFYFHEFMTAASRHDLMYLCDAETNVPWTDLPENVQTTLRAAGVDDLITCEQYVDFLRGRMFRRTLLVHREAQVQRDQPPDVLHRLFLSALVRPTQPQLDPLARDTITFHTESENTIDVANPVLKILLMTLLADWPAAIAWPELWKRMEAQLKKAGLPCDDEVRAGLEPGVVRLIWLGFIGVHRAPTAFTLHPGERPVAARVARLQARAGAPICSRRHRTVELVPFDQSLLTLLDGTRTRAELADELFHRLSPPPDDPDTIREAIVAEIEPSLFRLARSGVVVA